MKITLQNLVSFLLEEEKYIEQLKVQAPALYGALVSYNNIEETNERGKKAKFQRIKALISNKAGNKEAIETVLDDKIEITDIAMNLHSLPSNVNVCGDVVEISSNPLEYKKLIEHGQKEKWKYNGLTIVPENGKWIIFFY
jgi:hypothetical protein